MVKHQISKNKTWALVNDIVQTAIQDYSPPELYYAARILVIMLEEDFQIQPTPGEPEFTQELKHEIDKYRIQNGKPSLN
jgi:hypothetical protein